MVIKRKTTEFITLTAKVENFFKKNGIEIAECYHCSFAVDEMDLKNIEQEMLEPALDSLNHYIAKVDDKNPKLWFWLFDDCLDNPSKSIVTLFALAKKENKHE